jgi:DNA-binding MarR family transcriptional regulator
VKKTILTTNEEAVLYGLIRHPHLNDSELHNQIGIKLSTLTSIKNRLIQQGYLRTLLVPMLNRLGYELLATIYTEFNPVIPFEDRISTTKKSIEVFNEIFFSIGEQEKGFSISISKNYTNIGRINDIRTETFGEVGLLDKAYPHEVIFPFETSHISRFFDFSRVLHNYFNLEGKPDTTSLGEWFDVVDNYALTPRENDVYTTLIQNPEDTTQQISEKVCMSRHTVSRMKNDFFEKNLLRHLRLPSLSKLGFEILAFYHVKFNPHHPPEKKDIDILDTNATFFLARRKYEMILLAVYPTYQDYKEDKMYKIRYLKENDFLSEIPLVRTYMFERLHVIKDFTFSPLAQQIISEEPPSL